MNIFKFLFSLIVIVFIVGFVALTFVDISAPPQLIEKTIPIEETSS